MESDFPKTKLKELNEENLKDDINENDIQKELTSEIKNPMITNSNENEEEKEKEINENEEEELVQQKMKNSENSINSMTKPFISLASLSRCQCCNSEFNSNENLPILLQCNHFFCKKCIETYFIEENVGIKCPIDGIVAKNLDDLVVIKKLIDDDLYQQINNNYNKSDNNENYIEENQNYNINSVENKESENYEISDDCCPIHKDQKLTHYVEDTRELICVYCAFNKLRNNSKMVIKEINEKINDYINDLDILLENNQKYAVSLQNILNEIHINKENEENKVIEIYDQLIAYLINSKNVCLNKIDDFFKNNTKYISDKLDYFSEKIQNGEKIKEELIEISNEPTGRLNQIIDKFNNFIRDINDNGKYDLNISQYKFVHDDENKVIKYLNNFADLKNKKKVIKFNMNNNLNFNLKNTINTNPNQTNENTQRDYPKFPVMDKVPISFGNRYNNIENNYLDNTNESINATLNKYIVPKNYNKKVNNENNIKTFQNLSNEDKLATLNKYTIPSKNIYSNK
jgi:hypothetical protein